MTRLWLGGLLLTMTAVLSAQPRSPSFLAGAPLDQALVTPHLEARAAGDVTIDADGRATLVVLVTPRPKMHVYAADVDGYVPLTVTPQAQPGMTVGKVGYPPPELYVFPPTGESSRAYMKPFKVSVPLTFTPDGRSRARNVSGVVTLRYQACDDRVCYRPTSGSFTYRFAG